MVKSTLKREDNIVTLDFEPSPLAAAVRRDLEFNKRIKNTIVANWKALGHDVKVTLELNENVNTYEIRSTLVNGLPTGGLTNKARSKLIL